MIKLTSKQEKLEITLESDIVFVYPRSEEASVLRGIVALKIPSPRRVETLRVSLTGVGTIMLKELTETNTQLLSSTVEILDGVSEIIDGGKSLYPFYFKIPSDSCVSHDSKHGTVKHYVQAMCTLKEEGLHKPYYSITGEKKYVKIVTNHAAPGDLPEGLETLIQDVGSDLGPFALQLSSAHLTVSAPLYMSLNLPALPEEKKCTFLTLKTFIVEKYSAETQRGIIEIPPERIPVFEMKMAEKWAPLEKVFRLPDHTKLHPSTHFSTETAIHTSHQFKLELTYRVDEKLRMLEVATPLTIGSCHCQVDHFVLPAYSCKAPVQKTGTKHVSCLCGVSTSELLAQQGKTLFRSRSNESSSTVSSNKS